ncbi:hypothetical protein ACW2Q0_14095 [Nocardia sp. R16R-3T]
MTGEGDDLRLWRGVAVRVVHAYTLPVPLVSTLRWLVALDGLFAFQYGYVTKPGLNV